MFTPPVISPAVIQDSTGKVTTYKDSNPAADNQLIAANDPSKAYNEVQSSSARELSGWV